MFYTARDLDTGKFLTIGMYDGKVAWGAKKDHLAFSAASEVASFMKKHFPKVRYELINI